MTKLIESRDTWLKNENPDLFHMLRALDGDAGALAWLRNESPGLWTLTRALGRDKSALAQLQTLAPAELEYVHGEIVNCGQVEWLAERSPELAWLFIAVRGDDDALKKLKRKKPALARIAVQLREQFSRLGTPTEPVDADGDVPLTEGASADVGILVGEHHLRQKEYARAVEAFTRAIENRPTADAYEGRARAYQALAAADDRKAAELRARR
jgi:hypothetical protein